MSRRTKEINKVTGSVIGISGKLIIYVLVILLLYQGMSLCYKFGYDVFYETSMEPAPGRDVEVVISEEVSTFDVGKTLKEQGLIASEYAFLFQSIFYEYKTHPGVYTLNTSMSSKDMLKMMDENVEGEGDSK